MTSVTHLTNQSQFIQSNAAFNGTNISGTIASNGISLSVAPGGGGADGYNILAAGSQTANTTGTIAFNNANGITFGMSNSSIITASHNGITTAMASNRGSDFVQATAAFAGTNATGTISSNGISVSVAPQTAFVFSNANGVTFGTNASTVTASVQTNYITTAMASNRGSDFVQANAAFAGTNATGTIASNGISVSVNPQTVQPVAASASNGSFNFSTLKFVEGLGVTWATQVNGIQASVKTDYQSSNANYLTSQSNQALSGSNGSFAFQTATFGNLNGLSFYTSNGSFVGSHNGLTTARASNDAIGLNTALTANGVSMTANSSGLSLNFPAFLTTAQPVGAYLTTARASNDAIGLNTAQSNVTWTVNSSGLSFDARGYAGTGSTFNGTNVTGSMTVNSNGVRLDLSAGAGGGAAVTASASNGSFTAGLLAFSNANNVTFGTSAGSIITASVAAPGAAAENNWFNLLGANTAGNTTASGSTIGLSGINLTLSGTNGSAINISAPATSSLSGTNGISISTNGATISVSGMNSNSQRFQYPSGALSALSAFGNGSFSINRMDVQNIVTATRVDMPVLMSVASSATANTWGFAMTAFAAVYTKNGSTLSSISSASQTLSFSAASNTAGSTQMIPAAIRPVSVPMNVYMTPGEYYVGYGISTNTSSLGTATTANGITISAFGGLGYSSAIAHVGDFTATTNTSTGLFGGMGVYSAAISTVPPAVSLSAINQTGSYYSRANIGIIFRNI